MADYVVRVEAATSDAEEKLRKVEKHIGNITKPAKIDLQLPSLDATVDALKTASTVLAEVSKQVITIGRSLNVGPFAVLNDLEDILGVVKNKGEQAVGVLEALSKATPGRILATSFDVATTSVNRFAERAAQLGYIIFGVTQSVGVLKQAFGGFFDETVGREIRLQESLLRTKTTLISTADVVRNGLRIEDPTKALQALDKPIEDVMKNIRRRSLDIAGTTSDAIIQVFGVVASQIGAIGGSLKDAEDLAITFAGALGTIGMSDPALANQEIRSILTGNIGPDSVLARSLGINNEDIQKAKRSSEGLVAWLQKRLEGFAAGQKLAAQGFAGIVSNIQEVREEVTRTFGAPLLAPMLEGLTVIYTRLQLIFDQLLKIAGATGSAIGATVSLIGEAGAKTPVFSAVTEGAQTQVFDDLTQEAERFSAFIIQQTLNLQRLIGRLIDNVTEGLARISQGLAALAIGLAVFKFEQFKVQLTTFTNLAQTINTLVVPALQAMLNLYGQFLQLPIVNYVNQVASVHQVLERIGVTSIIRLAGTWSFYKQSIDTAIGWVKTAINWVKQAVTNTLDFFASSVEGIGRTIESALGGIIRGATWATITVMRLFQSAVQGIGVLLARLARSIKAAFPGSAAAAAVASGLRGISREFLNIDKSVRAASRSIGNFANKAVQDLSAIEQKAKETANQIRGIGGIIATKLGEGLQKLASGLGSTIMGLIKFQAYLLVLEWATSAVTEAYGRWQRAQEQAANSKRVQEAIQRLSGYYKAFGDDLDYATKRKKEFDEQIVESQYTTNEEELEKLKTRLGELRKLQAEIAEPGIQSWGELGNIIMPDFITGIEIALEDIEKLEKSLFNLGNSANEASNLFTFGIGQFMQPVNAFNETIEETFSSIIKAIPDFIKKFQWLADSIGDTVKGMIFNIIPGLRYLNYFIDIRDRIAQRNQTRTEQRITGLESEQRQIEALRDRQRQEENIGLAQKARTEGLKELKEYERQLDSQLFQERQNLAEKEVEIYKSFETFRIDQLTKANKKRLEGEEGASEAALNALADWIDTKKKAELEAQTIDKTLKIELANLDRKVVDYRYEMEKRIAKIRMTAAQYDAQVRAGAAATEASGLINPGSGSSNDPTSPQILQKALESTRDLAGVNNKCAEAVKRFMQQLGVNTSVMNQSADSVKRMGQVMTDWSQLQPGDIVVRGEVTGKAQHAGVYTGGQSVFHQSASRGLTAGNYDDLGYFREKGYFIRPYESSKFGTRAASTLGGGGGGNYSLERQALLDTISYAEGTYDKPNNGYGTRLGGSQYNFNGPHPGNVINAGRWSSNAAGRYQFLSPTWQSATKGAGVSANSMAPGNQDAAALYLVQQRGVDFNELATNGLTRNIQNKLAPEWASFPTHSGRSYYGQPVKDPKSLSDFYQARLQELRTGQGRPPSSAISGGAQPAGGAVPPMPQIELGEITDIGQAFEAVQARIGVLLQKSAELRKRILEANTAEQFENISKTLFPTVPLEQYDNKIIEIQENLKLIDKYADLAYDPQRLAIAAEFTTKQAIAERELKEYIAGVNKLEGTDAATKDKLIAKATERHKAYNQELENERKKKEEILELDRKRAAIQQLATDARQILLNTQTQILDAGFAARAAALPEDDYRARRRLEAEQSIARRRLQLEQEGVYGPELEARLKQFEEAARASAEALATLDENAAELAERLRLAKESAKTLTDGYKGMLSKIMQGGDITEAVQEMGRTVAAKFTDMMLDYAFKPIEMELEKQFRKLFKVDEVQDKNTLAINELTNTIRELIAAMTGKSGSTAPADNNPFSPSAESDLDPTAGYSGQFNITKPEDFKFDTPPVDWNFGTKDPNFWKTEVVPLQAAQASEAVAAGSETAAESQAKLADSLNKTADTAKKSAQSQTKAGDTAAEGMQKAAVGIATVATSALSIVGGIQSIKKGGTYNVLSGIGSIFMGLGSGLSGLNGMGLFGGKKAAGGPVSARTPYLVGERGPELFVPNGYGNITANHRLREVMGATPGTHQDRMALDLKFESRVINGVEYISRDQLDAAMEQTRRRSASEGAKRGMSMTLDKLKQSPATRSKLGLR